MRARFPIWLILTLSLLTVAAAQNAEANDPLVIPAGTKISLELKQAISTRSAKQGDVVYAESVFPVLADGHVVIPAGASFQGLVTKVKRAGKMKGHPEIGIRFTAIIRPDNSVLPLTGYVDNSPGGDNLWGTAGASSIQGEREDHKNASEYRRAADKGAIHGFFYGLLFGGSATGMRVGVGLGAASGLTWMILARRSDMQLRRGTQLQMTVEAPVPLDAAPVATPSVHDPGGRPRSYQPETTTTQITDENRRPR